jgi:hypothetical protein
MTRSCRVQLGEAKEVAIKVNLIISHLGLPIAEWIVFELRQEFWVATFEFDEGTQGLAFAAASVPRKGRQSTASWHNDLPQTSESALADSRFGYHFPQAYVIPCLDWPRIQSG